MKNSRKIKKVLVSILTATLSIIMFVTQVGALDAVTYNATFEEEAEIVSASEYMIWDYHERRNFLSVGVDLECYECDNVEYVTVSVGVAVGYLASPTAVNFSYVTSDSDSGSFTYLDTDESDELIVNIYNIDRGYYETVISAVIQYDIVYDNGDVEYYEYTYTASIINGEDFDCERILTYYEYVED